MTVLRLLLNVLWIITGGIWMAAAWIIAGCLMLISIVGIPWAWSAFRIGAFTLLPFGHRAVRRSRFAGEGGPGSGPLGVLGNVIWLVLAGWWLALGHLVAAVLLAVTVIGIPFAWAHLKLAGLALWPVGTEIVPIGARPREPFPY